MKTIKGKKWYKPREIARLGLIVNSKDNGNELSSYNFILELIKSGRIRAKDYSTGTKMHYWLVPEDEIARYHDTVTRLD